MAKIALVFSGQGAQYSGMGKELYEASPKAKEVFERCDAIRPGTSQQCFAGTKEELTQTINTQPCLFCVDLAAAAAVLESGLEPDALAGFSLGELPALCIGEALSLEDSFKLVCERARLMHEASTQSNSTMMAILKLSTPKVEELCAQAGNVYPVNYNCEGQIVVAGKQEALNAFAETVKSEGGRAMPLAVSGGFHSPYMDPARQGLTAFMQGISFDLPAIPVYANVSAKPYGDNGAELLARQVNSPVLWQKTIENMLADGIDTFIEVGAGKTLSSLIKKIAPEAVTFNVEDQASLQETISKLVREVVTV